jgi:hypothetical protein
MSNDIECRRCGQTVSEKSIEDGSHECDESALLRRIEELEDRLSTLEGKLIDRGFLPETRS